MLIDKTYQSESLRLLGLIYFLSSAVLEVAAGARRGLTLWLKSTMTECGADNVLMFELQGNMCDKEFWGSILWFVREQ